MDGDFRIGDWLVQPLRDVIESPQKSVSLEPKAMDLLVYLAQHQGEVLPKERLIQAVWPDAFVTDEVLTNNIWKLRQVFGDEPKNPKIIQTVPRRGYQLIAEVSFEERSEEEDGRYEIGNKIGQGAMGEVYLGADTVLRRKVALKFVREEMDQDASWHRRLVREARSAAALDHPFICKVYDTGQLEGRIFIAMEYVKGESLKELLQQGPLPLDQAIQIAREAAEALETAHDKSLVHRDIKPSNLMLTEQGHVKVMDFGVAKKLHSAKEDDQEWTSTLTTDASSMGTLPYMSPEQVRGQAVDTRSDIFSLGVVLYEMLTGVHPFRRPLSADSAAATLNEDPAPMSKFRRDLPRGVQKLLEKMLAKDRADRYQSIGEVLEGLDQLDSQKLSILAIETLKKYWRGVSLGVAGLAAVVAISAFVGWNPLSTDVPQSPSLPVPLTSYPGVEDNLALSPDGRDVAFAWDGKEPGNQDIYVQVVGTTTEPRRLTDDPASDSYPTWSHNGSRVAFLRKESGANRGIYMVPVLGDSPIRLDSCNFGIDVFGGGGLSWSPDDQFLAFPHRDSPDVPNSIYLISLETREKKKLTSPPLGVGDMWPAFSPDGTQVAFLRSEAFNRYIYVQDVQGGAARQLMHVLWFPRGLDWTSDGSAVVVAISKAFYQDAYLARVPLDGSAPERLTVGDGATDVSIARTGGRMAYERAQSIHDLWRVSGPNATELVPPARLPASSTRAESLPEYSPDGTQIAFVSDRSGELGVWLSDADGRELQPLTDIGYAKMGSWSPSGDQIGFASFSPEDNSFDIFVVKATGGTSFNLTPDASWDYAPSWTPDGSWIYYSSEREGKLQICRIPAEGGPTEQLTENGGEVPKVLEDGQVLFWREDGIWRLAPDGFEETLVLDRKVGFFDWNVWNGKIVYLDEDEDNPVIEMFNPDSGETERLHTFDEGTILGNGLTVSPDGQWIVYGQVENKSDFMLVENFY